MMRKIHFVAMTLIVAGVLMGSGIPGYCAEPPTPRLRGAFVQYGTGLESWSLNQWNQALSAMKSAHMDTLIVQFHVYEDRVGADRRLVQSRYLDGDDSPTSKILSLAAVHGIDVYMGLIYPPEWNAEVPNGLDIRDYVHRSNCVAKELWNKYGNNPRFAGWYIPVELWDGPFTPRELQKLHQMHRDIVSACDQLTSSTGRGLLPVAISPYATCGGISEEVTVNATTAAITMSQYVLGTGIDLLILQDSIGKSEADCDRCQCPTIDQTTGSIENIRQYYAALSAQLAGSGVEFWANVESFGQPCCTPASFDSNGNYQGRTDCVNRARDNRNCNATLIPTSFSRFQRQLMATEGHTTSVITWQLPMLAEPAPTELFNQYSDWIGIGPSEARDWTNYDEQ